jgi:hypothetical protein
VLRAQLEQQELQVLKVTRAIKVTSVLRVQQELQALKVTRAIKVMSVLKVTKAIKVM